MVVGLMVAVNHSHSATVEFHNLVAAASPSLWYRLNESSGNAVNYGTLGSSHDALFNGTIVRDRTTLGGDAGVHFDSTDDYLQSLGVSHLTGNPTFSIETVVYLPQDGVASLWGPYLHWGDGLTGKEVYFSTQQQNLNRVYAGFYNAGQRTVNPLQLNRWWHIVWTRQGGNDSANGSVLYLNGQSVMLEQDPNLIPGFLSASQIDVTATEFRINRARDQTRFWRGAMDEIALYDRVLDGSEILDRFRELIPDCDFDENLACDVADINLLLSEGPIDVGVAVVVGSNDQFDLTGDGTIDLADLDEWLAQAAPVHGLGSPYKRGDANLDGVVDGTDFNLWNANKFTNNLFWNAGNFNGDAVVDGSDFNLWNGVKFTSSDVTGVVPEGVTSGWIGLMILSCGLKARRRCTIPGQTA
jgi:hypothetical protein